MANNADGRTCRCSSRPKRQITKRTVTLFRSISPLRSRLSGLVKVTAMLLALAEAETQLVLTVSAVVQAEVAPAEAAAVADAVVVEAVEVVAAGEVVEAVEADAGLVLFVLSSAAHLLSAPESNPWS